MLVRTADGESEVSPAEGMKRSKSELVLRREQPPDPPPGDFRAKRMR